MGYSVTMFLRGVIIPWPYVPTCLNAIQALGSEDSFFRPVEGVYASLLEALEDCSFAAAEGTKGVYLTEFTREKWYAHRYEPLFVAIAPYVMNGGLIVVIGEDWNEWRYDFVDGAVEKKYAHVHWEDEPSRIAALKGIVNKILPLLPRDGEAWLLMLEAGRMLERY